MSWELNIRLYEPVQNVNKNDEIFAIETSRSKYEAKAVVLATGFYDLPFMMGVPGEELPKVKHYYDEPHPYFGQKVIVVGAANSAVDVALETYRKGADVTMVVREPSLLDSVKYWVKPDIENRIKEGVIKSYFGSEITDIRACEVDIITPEGGKTIENDFVLAMTGYKPDFEFMKALGISFNTDEMHTPVYNEKTNESNVANLFLAGVVCGGLKTNKWFIENSRIHADMIMDTLKERLKN